MSKEFLESSYSADEFLSGIFSVLRSKHSVEWICEKTPGHLWHAARILDQFADAKVVCMVRDPRASISSLLRVDWTHNDCRRHAVTWLEAAKTARDLSARYSDRFFFVRFEDLVAEPKWVLANLCEQIGMGYSEKLIESGGSAEAIPERERGWKRLATGGLEQSRTKAWKSELSCRDRMIIGSVLNRRIKDYGYEPDPTGPSLGYALELLKSNMLLFLCRPKILWLARGVRKVANKLGLPTGEVGQKTF